MGGAVIEPGRCIRVRSGMVIRKAFLFILFPFGVAAQPGPIEIPLHVVVELDHALYRDEAPQYMVISPNSDTLFADEMRAANGDSMLSFHVHASRDDRPWSVKYLPGGAMMDLLLAHAPSPLGVSLLLPFTQGAFELDTRRLMKCLNDQSNTLEVLDARRRALNAGEFPGAVDTLACHGGQVIWSRGGSVHSSVRIPDLMPFVKRMPRIPPTSAREASYPGGMENFHRFIRIHFNKPMIERLKAPVKLSAVVTIETDGSIHQVNLNGSGHPELDREFKRVLQLSSLWEAASQTQPQVNSDAASFSFIEQRMVIEYTVEPKSVWQEMPDGWLSLGPTPLRSTDSLEIHIRWHGGSCGKYDATTELLPQQPDEDFREVILRFGTVLPAMCEDMSDQHFMHKMAPLPPGKYRLRRLPHPVLPDAVWATDPYSVKFFDVVR